MRLQCQFHRYYSNSWTCILDKKRLWPLSCFSFALSRRKLAIKRGNVFCLSFRPSSVFYSTKTSYGETSVRRFSTHINGELVKVLLDMTWLWPTNTNDNTATHQLKIIVYTTIMCMYWEKANVDFEFSPLKLGGKRTKTEDCTILENVTVRCFRNDSKCINSHWTAKEPAHSKIAGSKKSQTRNCNKQLETR